MIRARLAAFLRLLGHRALAMCALYIVVRVVFVLVSGDEGLLEVHGRVRLMAVLFGTATLALRVILLFFVLPSVAARLVSALVRRV